MSKSSTMKKPNRLYVVWPKPCAKKMPKELRHPDVFTTQKAAADCALDDEEVIVYVLQEDFTK